MSEEKTFAPSAKRRRDAAQKGDVLRSRVLRPIEKIDALMVLYENHLRITPATTTDPDTGDTLAFGSTTGNLYVTEDQGDHWHAVTHHLPPVHAVRFMGSMD